MIRFISQYDRFRLVAFVLLAMLTAFLYGDALSFGYVWDDTLLFVEKISLLNEPLSWSLLVEPVLPGTTYMRPLVFLTFYIEFAVFGQTPEVSHLINVCLLFLNGFLVCLVANRVHRRRTNVDGFLPSLIVAVIYVVHPALIEASAWVSGRFDLLATFFILCGSYVFLADLGARLKSIFVSVCFFFALLSKELGIVMPLIVLCLWMAIQPSSVPLWQRFKDGWMIHKWLVFGFGAFVFLYFYLRLSAMTSVYHAPINFGELVFSYFSELKPFKSFGLYTVITFFPFYDLGPLHPESAVNPSTVSFWVGIIGLPLFLLVTFWGVIRGKAVAWLMLSAFLPLSLVLHFIPITIGGTIICERFLAAPLAFGLIAAAQINYRKVLRRLPVRRSFAFGVGVSVFASWLILSIFLHNSYLKRWESDLSLWSAAYAMYPEFPASKYNYLYSLIVSGEIGKALTLLELWREQNGGLAHYEQALYADILVRKGNEEGLKYLEGLIFSMPKFHNVQRGRDLVNRYLMTSKQVGGVYSTYVSALIMFEGDLDRARENLNYAKWYLRKGEDVFLSYQAAALMLLSGKPDESIDVLADLQQLNFSQRSSYERFFNTLLGNYCGEFGEQNAVCSTWDPTDWWARVKLSQS